MSRDIVNSESKAKQDNRDNTWGPLICDAEMRIKDAQRRIIELRKSIRFFEKQRATGKPFPLQWEFLCKEESYCAGGGKSAKPLEMGRGACFV